MKQKNAADLSPYFLLYPSANDRKSEGVAKVDYDIFRTQTLSSGERFDGVLPSNLIQLTKGHPSDCLGNPMGWLIVSKKCADCLKPHISTHAQIIPMPVTLPDGTVAEDRYRVINPIVVLDAIYSPGKKKSKVTYLEMVIEEGKIPEGTNIFRLKYSEITIVVASIIIRAIQDTNLDGFSGSPLDIH
jgi:hypothetical protein